REAHGVTDIVELAHRVRVHGQHERKLPLARGARPLRLEIETMRIAVDLDRPARGRERIEDLLHATRNGRTARHETAERMTPDLEDWMPHRAQQAGGHLLLVLAVTVVDARNDDVEAFEDLVGPVEGAVRED